MDVLAESLSKEFPATNDGVQLRLIALREAEVGNMRPYLLLLIGAAAMVLLICCVNVANLLLAHASQRAREIAIRTALGSSRTRIVQLLLTESLMLSLIGGTL